ncbi:MAG: DMT family transporter [Dehalococcoidia bacterium]
MAASSLAIVFAFVAASGFAVGTILIRIGMQQVAAATATFFTVLVGAVLVLSLALAFNLPDIKTLPPVAFAWFALMGAMAYPVARVVNNKAIALIGASRATPMASLQPVFALALGIAFLGERPNLLVSLGTPMVVVGLLLVFLTTNVNGATERVLNTRNLGYLLAIAGAATFASRDVISRHVVSGISPPLVAAGFALLIGGAMLLTIIRRDVFNSLRNLPPKYIAICCIAGVFQGIAIGSLFVALSRAPVTVVSPINASSPLITLALAHIFLRRLETLSWVLALGTLISVGGVVLVVLGAASN